MTTINWQPLEKLKLNSNEVHLIAADLSENSELAVYEGYLSSQEKQRAKRFYSFELRSHFIMARGILRKVLGDCLNISPEQIEFQYQDLGKPELKNYPDLQFNLSHTGPIALYALSLKQPIGVDIERIRSCDELELAERFFAQSEYQSLLNLKPELRLDAFFQIWTQKEAYIKALGKGLAYLDQFSVADSEALKDWHLKVFDYQYEYKAAFATKQLVKHVGYWKFAK
ncbi:MAG: 4-phosphopantetheinyl transferase [Gammaproteobacteria bacterium]|jgi:4'-phosphopantetheinyl transferase|nr:4-phosphopantetheinyl transferase [Gammaproteobacteria bacterium]